MSDLDRLIEAVEAGEWKAGGDGSDTWLIIFDSGLRPFHGHIYEAWHGSLDAAKRLHDALLPGLFWNMGHLDQPSLGYVCTVADGHFADSPSWRGYAMDPARAWLLAILRAVKAKAQL